MNIGEFPWYRIPHPVLGWTLEPGVSYSNHMPETTVQVSYNAGGWRDTEHAVENPRRVFRVVVLGDSFMEAYSVDLEDAFHRRLEKIASQLGYEIEVINLGVGGYGTLQEYLALREAGKQYQPDVVLLGFYTGNDVRNNSLELESLVITGLLKVHSRPFLDTSDPHVWRIKQVDFEGAQRRYVAVKARRNTLGKRLARQSALIHAAGKATAPVVQMVSQLVSSKSEPPPTPEVTLSLADQERRYLALHGANFCVEPAEYTQAWTTTARILDRLKNEVHAIHSKLVVFTVPALSEVSIPVMQQVKADALDTNALCLEEPPVYERLRAVLNELGIELVDLLPAFRQAMQDGGGNLYWPSDGHWNPAGHMLAAQIVMSALVEKKYVPVHRRRDGFLPSQE